MFRKAKKHKMCKGAAWICDGHDYDSGVNASVIVDGSGYSTTSYSCYTHYAENLLLDMNILDAKHEEDIKTGVDSTSEPSNT